MGTAGDADDGENVLGGVERLGLVAPGFGTNETVKARFWP